MFGLVRPSRLRAAGVLGMNARNHAFIQAYNERHLYPGVDDKVLTKTLLQRAGLNSPKLLGVVRYQHDIKRDLPKMLTKLDRFAIKPAHGSGGRGIVVITGRKMGDFVKSSGAVVKIDELQRHVTHILSGLYSLGGRADVAMIEQCIRFTDVFDRFTYQGVPDVRIIVFHGYPVMAMMRLSTEASDGKANLHQGAVGVGINLRDGSAIRAVQHNRPLTHHPDTNALLDELIVPRWAEHLELATRCYEVTKLGYFGADIVLDAEQGPMIIELNARPGLAIQIANHQGLAPRLHAVLDMELDPPRPIAERVKLASERFGL